MRTILGAAFAGLIMLGVQAAAHAAILGTDNRDVDVGQYPWTESVGYITRATPDGHLAGSIGTAFVVGPRVILTNWHNLFTEDGKLPPGEWVYLPDAGATKRRIKILHHFKFTPMTAGDLPLRPRTRSHDMIALVLAEPVDVAPLRIVPASKAALPTGKDVGPARYAMAGVSLTFDFDGATPRTVQSGCSFASLAPNAQFGGMPGLIAHTCDVWPGHSGAPLVEANGKGWTVRALNVAQVIPELTREAYEERIQEGETVPMNIATHINIAIPITPQMVDLVAAANAFAKTAVP